MILPFGPIRLEFPIVGAGVDRFRTIGFQALGFLGVDVAPSFQQ